MIKYSYVLEPAQPIVVVWSWFVCRRSVVARVDV